MHHSKFVITNHCKERYLQRFNKKYTHLNTNCSGCLLCDNLKRELKRDADNLSLIKEIRDKINNSNSTKIHHNNFRFMESMYEKYGFESRFDFYVYDNILFICRDGNVAVTCIDVGSSILRDFVKRPKYKKKV